MHIVAEVKSLYTESVYKGSSWKLIMYEPKMRGDLIFSLKRMDWHFFKNPAIREQ